MGPGDDAAEVRTYLCPECSESVEARAPVCSGCGCEFETEDFECMVCGTTVSAESESCPSCGTEFVGPDRPLRRVPLQSLRPEADRRALRKAWLRGDRGGKGYGTAPGPEDLDDSLQ